MIDRFVLLKGLFSRSTLLGLLFFSTTYGRAALLNDDFADALPITADETFLHGRFAEATTEPREPAVVSEAVPPERTLWWKYIPQKPGYLLCQRESPLESVRTVFALYRGNVLTNLTRIGFLRRGVIRVAPGETYYFQLEGSSYPPPSSGVRVLFREGPENDNLESATPLPPQYGSLLGFNAGASRQASEPTFTDRVAGMTVWYSWAAPYEGTVTFGLAGDGMRMNFFRGTSFENLTRLPVRSGAPDWDYLTEQITVQKGETFYLQLDSIPRGGAAFRVDVLPSPAEAPNDNFSQASSIQGDRGAESGSFKYASVEVGEPAHRTDAHKSLWWKWYAPRAGGLRLSSSFGTIQTPPSTLAIYKGASLPELQLLAANEARLGVSVNVQAGQLYYLALAAPIEQEGSLTFSLSMSGLSIPADPGNLVIWNQDAWSFSNGPGNVLHNQLDLSPTPATVSQTIPVMPGTLYSLAFSYKAPEHAVFKVKWDGVELATVQGDDWLINQWARTNLLFTASGDSGILSFENVEGPISLSEVTIKTAEPVSRQSQTIEFSPSSTAEFAGTPLLLEATASSGLPVTLTILSGPAQIEENRLIPLGVGDVVIRASQPGNDQFAPAANIDRTISILPAPQSIQVAEIAPVRFGDGPIRLVATSSAGLSITFELVSGPGELNVDLLTIKGAGTIVVKATPSENPNYLPASALLNIPVAKASQLITFTPPATIMKNSSINLIASASSGLPVTFAFVSGPGELTEGVILTAQGEGDLVVTALQPGNDNFEPAAPVERTIRSTTPRPLAISRSPDGVTLTWGEQAPPIVIEAASSIAGPWEVFDTVQSGDSLNIPATGVARFFRCRVED